VEQLTQEPTFDAEFASYQYSITNGDIDCNPAIHPLEPEILTEEVIQDASVLAGSANDSNGWTYLTLTMGYKEEVVVEEKDEVGEEDEVEEEEQVGEEEVKEEEVEEEEMRHLTFNEKNFYYIADANIVDWVDGHPNDPKEYIQAVALEFAPYDVYYMCNCTTKQYAM
jgi:hypothetical protein